MNLDEISNTIAQINNRYRSLDHDKINGLRKAAFAMTPAEQYRLAFFIAENIGFDLKRTETR